MAQFVYTVAKAPSRWRAGWRRLRNERRGVRDGDGVQITVPSDAKVREVAPTEPWPMEWNAYLK